MKAWQHQRAQERAEIRKRRQTPEAHAQHLHDMRTRKIVRSAVARIGIAVDELALRGLDVPVNEATLLRRAGDVSQLVESLIADLCKHFGHEALLDP